MRRINLKDEIEVVQTSYNSLGRKDYHYANSFGLQWQKWFDNPEERDEYWKKLKSELTLRGNG